MTGFKQSRSAKRRWTPIILIAAVIVIAGIAAWPSVSGFLAEDDCLDAGGVWRNSACEGRRPGE